MGKLSGQSFQGIMPGGRWPHCVRTHQTVWPVDTLFVLQGTSTHVNARLLAWWCVSFSTLAPFTATTRSPARSPDASAGEPGSTLRMNCPLFPFSPCKWNPYPVSPFTMRQSRGFSSLVISTRRFFFFFFKTSLQCSVQVWLIRRWEFRRAGAGLNFHRAKTYLPDAHAFPHVRETLRTRRKQLQMHFRKRNPTLENTCNGGQQSKSLGKRWCDQSSRSCVLCRALLATPKTDPWQRAQTSTAPHRRYRRRVPNDAQGSPLLETLIHNNCAVDMHAVIL